jgi:hypothetical protein
MKITLLTAVGIMFSANAWATGGFSCEIKQKGFKIEVTGGTTRSSGSEIFSSTGTLKGVIRDGKKKIPLSITFTKANVSQYWNMGNDFRIAYRIENDGPVFTETMLIIETKGTDKGDDEYLKGTATVNHYVANGERITRRYDATCMVE